MKTIRYRRCAETKEPLENCAQKQGKQTVRAGQNDVIEQCEETRGPLGNYAQKLGKQTVRAEHNDVIELCFPRITSVFVFLFSHLTPAHCTITLFFSSFWLLFMTK